MEAIFWWVKAFHDLTKSDTQRPHKAISSGLVSTGLVSTSRGLLHLYAKACEKERKRKRDENAVRCIF
jgi:hypothetical protein